MTIIQPNKNNFKIDFAISVLMLIFIISAAWGVYLYNQTVNFRHETENISRILKQNEVENAELKNILYSIIDLKNSESFTVNDSLVLEKNPEYIKSTNLEAEASLRHGASNQQFTTNR